MDSERGGVRINPRGRAASRESAESEHGRGEPRAPSPAAALALELISANALPDACLHLVQARVQRSGAQGGEERGQEIRHLTKIRMDLPDPSSVFFEGYGAQRAYKKQRAISIEDMS